MGKCGGGRVRRARQVLITLDTFGEQDRSRYEADSYRLKHNPISKGVLIIDEGRGMV